MHLPPDFKAVVVPRRGRSAEASSPATDYFNPNPDQWEGKVSALLQVFVVHQRIENQEHNTNCYTSAVGEAPSPDGRVLSDLAFSCLAYGAVAALRSSACLGHGSIGYTYESSFRQIRAVSGLLVRYMLHFTIC